MPIQSTAHKTIGAPAPSNTTPRALRPRSHLLVTGSYAIMLPMGGVASVSKTARDSDGCWESADKSTADALVMAPKIGSATRRINKNCEVMGLRRFEAVHESIDAICA